jgi:hypothetical protein
MKDALEDDKNAKRDQQRYKLGNIESIKEPLHGCADDK